MKEQSQKECAGLKGLAMPIKFKGIDGKMIVAIIVTEDPTAMLEYASYAKQHDQEVEILVPLPALLMFPTVDGAEARKAMEAGKGKGFNFPENPILGKN